MGPRGSSGAAVAALAALLPIAASGAAVAQRPAPSTRREAPAPDPETAKLAGYQAAAAAKFRVPETTRFRDLHIVRTRSGERDVLCGEVDGANAYGGRTGWVPFSAEMIPRPGGVEAVVFTAREMDADIIAAQCAARPSTR